MPNGNLGRRTRRFQARRKSDYSALCRPRNFAIIFLSNHRQSQQIIQKIHHIFQSFSLHICPNRFSKTPCFAYFYLNFSTFMMSYLLPIYWLCNACPPDNRKRKRRQGLQSSNEGGLDRQNQGEP